MQKLKARYVGKVIEVFTSGRFSRLTELRVVRWLLNGKDNEEKTVLLMSYGNARLKKSR